MKCSKCGTKIKDNEKECNKCGNKLVVDKKQKFIEFVKNNKKIVAIVGIVLFIFLVAFLVIRGLTKKDAKEFDINYSTSFFIKNKENKYAMFNDDGKQLTDFTFSSASEFINGVAIVKDGDKTGLISSDGKMVVDFGKYEYFTTSAGLFKARGEDYQYYLLGNDGNVLYDLKDKKVETFLGEDTYSILKDEKAENYKVLNYKGKSIVSFPEAKDAEEPTTNASEEYVSVFYNGKNYILNIQTGKEILSFDDANHYCVNQVKNDGKLITLNSCVSWYESKDETYYKVIDNGKLIDVNSTCDKVYFMGDVLICNEKSIEYFFDKDYNKGASLSETVYYSNKNYAKNKNGRKEGVDFYNQDKVVKNVPCRVLYSTGYVEQGIYVLTSAYNNECGDPVGIYEYYNSNGEKIADNSFAQAKKFDENGLAQVSDDKVNYYLIDKTGKQLGDTYSRITNSEGYYIVKKNNSGLLDKSGKEIFPCEYSSISISVKQNNPYAILKTSDSKTIIYNLDNRKEIFSSDKSVTLNDHYFFITNENKKQYYSYTTGKMFYEE